MTETTNTDNTALKVMIAIGVAALLVVFGAVRIASNESAKNYPPAACQLFGGTWSIWSGWHCG